MRKTTERVYNYKPVGKRIKTIPKGAKSGPGKYGGSAIFADLIDRQKLKAKYKKKLAQQKTSDYY